MGRAGGLEILGSYIHLQLAAGTEWSLLAAGDLIKRCMLHWGLSSCLFLLHTSDRERKCFSFFLTSVLTLIKPIPDWSCESTSPSVFLNVMGNPSWDSQTPLYLCFLTGRLMLFPEPASGQSGRGTVKPAEMGSPDGKPRNTACLVTATAWKPCLSSKHLLHHVPVHSHTGTFITCSQQSWAKIRKNNFW